MSTSSGTGARSRCTLTASSPWHLLLVTHARLRSHTGADPLSSWCPGVNLFYDMLFDEPPTPEKVQSAMNTLALVSSLLLGVVMAQVRTRSTRKRASVDCSGHTVALLPRPWVTKRSAL
jgi:hypothetical protein